MSRGSEWRRWDLHVHTASSYDYKYKANDSDELLVKSWREKKLSVVAITDHFLIDSERIKKLELLAPEITIFPGVELRCDKGTSNLHVIIIFPNRDLDKLATKFDIIMKDEKANNKESNERIYWDYKDIIEFAKSNSGIVSVHAGKKEKGIDDGITNSLEVNMAIKMEISEFADIFEIGRIKDINTYNKTVFNFIKRKPMIICSDNHDPRNYITRENQWIKGDTTYDGLLQAIKEPELRFFVGEIPPKKKIVDDNKNKFIDCIKIKGVDASDKWFNNEIPLSSDLVTIIGNKGNGKSALADIIGHAGNTHSSRYSFLSKEKFNQKPDYLGKNYEITLKWKNGVEEEKLLFPTDNNSLLEKVKYLPQQYIEYVCNDLKEGFHDEIERLIFDYLPQEEKLGLDSLNNLMKYLTSNIITDIDLNQKKLKDINNEIIDRENKIAESEKQILSKKLIDYNKQLELEIKNSPENVVRPNIDPQVEVTLNTLSVGIEDLKKELEIKKCDLENLSKKQYTIDNTFEQIQKTKSSIAEWTSKINTNLLNNGVKETVIVKLDINNEKLLTLKDEVKKQINNIKLETSTIEIDKKDGTLVLKLKELKQKVKDLTSKLSIAESNHQKYLQNSIRWRAKCSKISEEVVKTKEEIRVLLEDIPLELNELFCSRKSVCKEIYLFKKSIVEKYAQKYSYINNAISELDMKKSEKPNIEINFNLEINSMERELFNHINQNIKSIFRGKEQAKENLSLLMETIKIDEFNSIYDSLEKMENELKNSASDYSKVFIDKLQFFNNLYGLDYIKTNYQLKLGEKLLGKLSPGERGLLLLVFYLLLDKENCPLIIDQPEDNLDNQSIFNRLVQYIIKAKAQRQIIIVTHNPNIAVACDSEQVIYSDMDKENLQIRYTYDSMESTKMKKHIIDVLEGTMPAFEKRSEKYNE